MSYRLFTLPTTTLLTLSCALLYADAAAQSTRTGTDQTLTLELLRRVEQLEKEVRTLRGELELQRHQLDALQDQDKAPAEPTRPATDASAPDRSITATTPPTPDKDQQATTPQHPAPTAKNTPDPPATSAMDEQKAFDKALGHWRDGDTTEAITAWHTFLSHYPESAQMADARYWLGEAYYAARDFEAAKEAFISLGVNHPQSPKIPDAMLKLADSYEELGNPARAKEVLNKLIEAYPRSPAARIAQERLPMPR